MARLLAITDNPSVALIKAFFMVPFTFLIAGYSIGTISVKPGDHNRHAIDSVARTMGGCILGSRTAFENAPLRFKMRHLICHDGWSVGDCLHQLAASR
jgi:hypothetical protein